MLGFGRKKKRNRGGGDDGDRRKRRGLPMPFAVALYVVGIVAFLGGILAVVGGVMLHNMPVEDLPTLGMFDNQTEWAGQAKADGTDLMILYGGIAGIVGSFVIYKITDWLT